MSEVKEETKHTPGEWIVTEDFEQILAEDTRNPNTGHWAICTLEAGCDNQGLGDGEEDKANACLIAAAPDLLAACQSLLSYLIDDNPGGFLGGDGYMTDLADKARAAISKATEV